MSYIREWHKYLNSAQTSNQGKSMKDMLWKRRENWKVNRMIFERVLLEGRLEDVKKKYGERLPGDYIDSLAFFDPSGNNKYLAHMVKLLLKYVEETGITEIQRYRPAIRAIGTTVGDFHDLNKYIPTEKGGRDIHSYKTFEDLTQAVKNAEAKKKAKDEAALFKEKVRGDADRIYQDKTTLVVRPGSEEASCYYGQGTKWCISATEARNYWDDYVGNQGAVFFFVLDKEAADEDKIGAPDRGKVAFVYDGDHLDADNPWDAYDESDDQLDGEDALSDYFAQGIWNREKYNEIIIGIQQSLEDDPPEPGMNLEEEADKLREYAEAELSDSLAGTIEFDIYGDNDEGMAAGAVLTFEFPMGWDPEDATRSVGMEEDAVEEAYKEGVNWDYMDFEYEFDHTNTSADGWPTLRIQARMTCEDCGGGYDLNQEQRQEYRDNTESFIDNIIGEYGGNEYNGYKEDLRQNLVNNKVIAPEKWDVDQIDIADQIKNLDLKHFKLHILKDSGTMTLLYEMVENADLGDAATPPDIGVYEERDAILYGVMKASAQSTTRGWYSSEFDHNSRAAIKQYFLEAQEAARKQLELPLGGEYKQADPPDWSDPSMMIYLKETVKRFQASVQVTFTKWHTTEDAKATMAYIQSLDERYDDIVDKLRDVYTNMTAEHTAMQEEEEQRILNGAIARHLIRKIDDKILSEPEGSRDAMVKTLTWVKDNFDKMSGVEKHAAVALLKELDNNRGVVGLNEKGVPYRWKYYVETELHRRGATHTQKQQYKWTGKRDELTEDRIQEVIRQTLIKVFNEEYKGPSRLAPPEGPLDTGKFQTRERAKHPAHKKRLIGMGKNKETGGGKGHKRPDMERSKSAPPMEEDKLID